MSLRTFCCALLVFIGLISACTSAYRESISGNDTVQIFQRIYLTDFNTAWQSILEVLKNTRLDVSNREAGLIQTRWTDNTAERSDGYFKAQYRIKVTVAKGFYNGRASVKVTVLKEQLVKRDVLESWRQVRTDSIDENTFLYRIGRMIAIQAQLAKLEAQKLNKSIEESEF